MMLTQAKLFSLWVAYNSQVHEPMVGVLFKESAYTCTQILKSAFNVDLITINVHYLKLTKLADPTTINLPLHTFNAAVTPQI